MTPLPQGLSRERLAELRALAEQAADGPWRRGNDVSGRLLLRGENGRFIADCGSEMFNDFRANAEHISTFDPQTVLALIAQCESSPTGEGEDGELARVLESLSYDSSTTSRDAHRIIVALLAERDGLRADRDEKRDDCLHASAELDKAESRLATVHSANAALAEAVALLREVTPIDGLMTAWRDDARMMTHQGFTDKWLERRDSFLAKHGPSP